MAESYRFESERREAASRFITAYKERITAEPLTREEIYAAFGGLVMSEFDYDAELAQKYLETDRSDFVNYEEALQSIEGVDAKLRLQAELYTLAPLIVLWQDIRELRTPDESGVWLSAAASLALAEAGPHDEEGCYCDDLNSDEVDCDWSPLCPVKMVTKSLIAQATQDPGGDLSYAVGPEDAITQVRMQLAAAGELGLLSKSQVKGLMQQYLSVRASPYES